MKKKNIAYLKNFDIYALRAVGRALKFCTIIPIICIGNSLLLIGALLAVYRWIFVCISRQYQVIIWPNFIFQDNLVFKWQGLIWKDSNWEKKYPNFMSKQCS